MPPRSWGRWGARGCGTKQSSVSMFNLGKQTQGQEKRFRYSLPGQQGCAAARVLVRTTTGSAARASRDRRSQGPWALTQPRRWQPLCHRAPHHPQPLSCG